MRRRATSKREGALRETIRKQQEVIRDLTRTGRQFDLGETQDDTGRDSERFEVPKGAKILQRDDDGDPIAFELPPLIESWDDAEWGDFDWDGLIDEYGEEEQDLYADEAG